MAEACPIVNFNVDEKVVRVNAFITLILLAVFVFTPWKWVIFVLAIDFFLRGFMKGKGSPLAAVSKLVLKALKISSAPINAGPKLFAAKIGFACSFLISIFYVFALMTPAYVVLGIVAVCAALEAFLGYCVGCKVYSLTRR